VPAPQHPINLKSTHMLSFLRCTVSHRWRLHGHLSFLLESKGPGLPSEAEVGGRWGREPFGARDWGLLCASTSSTSVLSRQLAGSNLLHHDSAGQVLPESTKAGSNAPVWFVESWQKVRGLAIGCGLGETDMTSTE
jgi:hypothetical protein